MRLGLFLTAIRVAHFQLFDRELTQSVFFIFIVFVLIVVFIFSYFAKIHLGYCKPRGLAIMN